MTNDGEGELPEGWEEFVRWQDLEDTDYDPGRWLDPETGEVTDRKEMFSQVSTLMKREEYETVIELATERLAATERPMDRVMYIF